MVYLIAILCFASVALLLLAVAKPQQVEDVQDRLKRLNQSPSETATLNPTLSTSETQESADAGLQRLKQQVGDALEPLARRSLAPEQVDAYRERLAKAGLYGEVPIAWRVKQLLGACLGATIATILSIGLAEARFGIWLPAVTIAGGIGYLYPIWQLRTLAANRQKAILRQLPSTLDLLTISVEAGLSLQAAMVKVVDKGRPSPLKDEFEQALREIQLGRPRAEALRTLGRRIDIKEVHSVVLAMIQAEAMGSSIGKALRTQAEIARENRWSRAQELAFQAPVKLTFPLVLFIFPPVFWVILGPVILELLSNMK
jgi:tight adherence protein C